MESLRQRRSKICVADRPRCTLSRGAWFRLAIGDELSEGDWQKQRHGNLGNIPPESSSCSSCTTEDDLLMLDFGRRSSKPVSVQNGTPVKKLLAKEMLWEAEVRRRPPGVIAKLMGLEGIPSPSQKTSGRSQRRQVEDLHMRRKVEKAGRSGNISSRGSSRRSSNDEQEFKDVFEVTEWSNVRSYDYVIPKTVEPDMSEAKMAFIGQRFWDAERLSTDDELQDLKEFGDTLEVLDSNKDLLLKFLQQPDPLFAKHVHDIQGTTFEPHWSKNVTVRKPVDARDCETISTASNSLRENVPRKHGKSIKNCQNCVPSQTPVALDGTSYKSTKRESLAAPYSFPTRIVVLKPHLGKGEDTPETNFSPSRQSLFSDSDIPPEFVCVESPETKLVNRKRNPDQSKNSRGIPREVSRKARSTSSSIGSVSVPSSRHKVSAGDESFSTKSLDEFAYYSDGTSASVNSLNRNNKCENLPSVESSVRMEAKRRLSERWKLAHKPRNKGKFSKGSSLAEMLATPDRLVRCTDLHKVGQQGLKRGAATSAEPLGISSRDGWKDVGLGKLSRSRSLPGSSTLIKSAAPRYSRTSRSRHDSCDFVETIPREVARWEKHRPMKGNINTFDRLATGELKYSCSERLSPSCRSCYSTDTSLEFDSTCVQVAIRPKEIDQSSRGAIEEEARVNPSPSNAPEASLQRVDSSVWFLDELLSKEPPCLVPENSPVAAHHSIPEPDSSTSSKEADQPSPVSVLEAPFADDFSYSSECFESLSADLHGLRIQLELLKLESGAYAEGSKFISGDDDAAEGVFHLLEGRDFHKPAENWEFSYVADMLMASGYVECESESFITKWHSPECPAGPSVFEELEKTYGNHNSSMSERKLLFDLINLSIQEIYQPLMDPCPWLRPAASVVHSNWRKDPLQETLLRLATSHFKKAGKSALDKPFISDGKWLNVSDGIDLIGKDLGNLFESELIDELLAV